ncbi:MAG TPA: hypothetical protein VF771_05720 [Longimicrobiaceae bacterium]
MPLPRSCRAIPLLFLLWGCGKVEPAPATEPRFRDRQLLTHDELNQVAFANAYQAVETLRSNWLISRGPSSLNSPSGVLVYLNNARLGGVETLRGISPQEIVYIRYYDPAAAAGRWGRDVASGVIMVSTERR